MNVIFDIGNVILEWNTEKLIRSLDLSESKRELIGKELFNNSYWTDLDQGIITEKEVIQCITARCELTASDLEDGFIKARESLIEIPETIDLMEELHNSNINMYCLSNMALETYSFIEYHPFFKYFNDIVISGFINMIKPNSDIFQYTLEKFDLKPENIIFIDDSYVNIVTARKFGINSIHFKRTEACYQQIRNMMSHLQNQKRLVLPSSPKGYGVTGRTNITRFIVSKSGKTTQKL